MRALILQFSQYVERGCSVLSGIVSKSVWRGVHVCETLHIGTVHHRTPFFMQDVGVCIILCISLIPCNLFLFVFRMASVLHKHLDSYHILQLVKLTQYLVVLHCQDLELFAKLKTLLLG